MPRSYLLRVFIWAFVSILSFLIAVPISEQTNIKWPVIVAIIVSIILMFSIGKRR